MRFVILSVVPWRAVARFPLITFNGVDSSRGGGSSRVLPCLRSVKPTHKSANIALEQRGSSPQEVMFVWTTQRKNVPGVIRSARSLVPIGMFFPFTFLRNIHVQILNIVVIHRCFSGTGMSKANYRCLGFLLKQKGPIFLKTLICRKSHNSPLLN